MDKKEFEAAVTTAVQTYIDNFDRFEPNPQIRVNPVTYFVEPMSGNDFFKEIEDSDEAIENAAYADGMATETADDYQVSQNPDFYPVKNLVKTVAGNVIPDPEAIGKIVANYF